MGSKQGEPRRLTTIVSMGFIVIGCKGRRKRKRATEKKKEVEKEREAEWAI